MGPGVVAVRGLAPARLACLGELELEPASWEDLLAVRVQWVSASGEPPPAVLGSYRVTGGALLFTPHFPFKPGLALEARFDGSRFDRLGACGEGVGERGPPTPDLALEFEAPEEARRPPTRVVAVYPSGDRVPENLLRIYVHFSGPMRPRDVSAAVRLIDEDGAPVELAFVEIDEGLWDPGRRRLTLFLHPGRIKRGVGPHQALGPPLREGRHYRLSIGRELRDARGLALEATYEKDFTVGPPDRESPDPERWRIHAPERPSGELVVDLPEPLDRALLLRMIEVVDGAGRSVPGLTSVGPGERHWRFRPTAEWGAGPYRLRVATAIEDLAGNTPAALFDRDGETSEARTESFLDLEFELR